MSFPRGNVSAIVERSGNVLGSNACVCPWLSQPLGEKFLVLGLL